MAEEASKKALVPGRQTLQRQKLGETVAGLFSTHAEAIGTGLARELGASGIDGKALAEQFGKRLIALGTECVDSDLAYQRETDGDGGLKDERTKAEEELRNAVHEVQEMATGMFGASVHGTLKLAGSVPGDLAGLVHFARDAAEAIGAADPESLPKPRIKGAQVDLKEWANLLSEPANRLLGVLEKLAKDEKANKSADQRKHHAIETFDRQFKRSVAMLESLLLYVGEIEAAEKIKPTLRGE